MKKIVLLSTLSLLGACSSILPHREAKPVIYASAETAPVTSAGDAADDPAIWVNRASPDLSLILGTDKKSGLAIYGLDGRQLQFLDRGRLNNIDLRQGIPVNGKRFDLAAATNRTEKSLDIFQITTAGKVTFVAAVPLKMADPYGTCMYLDHEGNAYAFVNDKSGEYQQWLLNPGRQFQPQLVGSFKLDSQPEGCAADDVSGTLYAGEENRGIWKMPAHAPKAVDRVLIDDTSRGHLVADVEGMDIYRHGEHTAYLIVSSQGDNSYAIYDLNDGDHYLGSFRIGDRPDGTVDGTEETDGLTVTSHALGKAYPQGVLVVQDGHNTNPEANQNFKLVPWEEVKGIIPQQ